MRRLLTVLLILSGLAGGGATAFACEIIGPDIRPGETVEQAMLREESGQQSDLLRESDSVFLARPTKDRLGERIRMVTIVPLLGHRPPSEVIVRPSSITCLVDWAPPRGTTVIFLAQSSWRDDFWRPWLWGRWQVLGWRPVEAVVDPHLTARLREAAAT